MKNQDEIVILYNAYLSKGISNETKDCEKVLNIEEFRLALEKDIRENGLAAQESRVLK